MIFKRLYFDSTKYYNNIPFCLSVCEKLSDIFNYVTALSNNAFKFSLLTLQRTYHDKISEYGTFLINYQLLYHQMFCLLLLKYCSPFYCYCEK